jgi:hypothetical protein
MAKGGEAKTPPTEKVQKPHNMSEEERAAIRKLGAQDARKSRKRQGLPERVEDPSAIAILAALFRDTRHATTGSKKRHGRNQAA